jgi:hypothetical protein
MHRGNHTTATECIDALRGVIAEMEMRLEARADAPQPAASHGIVRRRERQWRKDYRFVILDGDRLCLTDAAARLGLSASALHYRLVNRTGTRNYKDVDVRAVGADTCLSRGFQHAKTLVAARGSSTTRTPHARG